MLRSVFSCLRKAGLKLSIAKCHFEVQEIVFLGRTITTKGAAAQKQKITKFLEKVNFPIGKRAVQYLTWIFHLLSKLHTRIGRTTHSVFPITLNDRCQRQNSGHPEKMKNFKEINEALDR